MITVTNKYGECFIAVPLKTLKFGEWFKRKPDSVRKYSKAHYNRKSRDYPTATYTCMPDNDVWGSGFEINAEAIVYVTE